MHPHPRIIASNEPPPSRMDRLIKRFGEAPILMACAWLGLAVFLALLFWVDMPGVDLAD